MLIENNKSKSLNFYLRNTRAFLENLYDTFAEFSKLNQSALQETCGFTPLTQDNNYDVIYKQTANYRQTEPAG